MLNNKKWKQGACKHRSCNSLHGEKILLCKYCSTKYHIAAFTVMLLGADIHLATALDSYFSFNNKLAITVSNLISCSAVCDLYTLCFILKKKYTKKTSKC